MARNVIKKIQFDFGSVGGFRVLACADTLARKPIGVRQYLISVFKFIFIVCMYCIVFDLAI
jgi:hypothetical protein